MKLGILLCDNVNQTLRSQYGDYSTMFAKLLLQTNAPLELAFYEVHKGEYPTELGECDAYLSTGSRCSVYDDLPWIDELVNFVRRLYDAQIGLVGICFGHQLIAHALGGKVSLSYNGWGLGISTAQIVNKKPWMSPELPLVGLIVSHQDQVIALPANSQVILANDFCPYSAIQVGDHFLGFQGHPEFTVEFSSALMNYRQDIIDPGRLEQGKRTLDKVADSQSVALWIVNFLQQTVKARKPTLYDLIK